MLSHPCIPAHTLTHTCSCIYTRSGALVRRAYTRIITYTHAYAPLAVGPLVRRAAAQAGGQDVPAGHVEVPGAAGEFQHHHALCVTVCVTLYVTVPFRRTEQQLCRDPMQLSLDST